MEAGLYHFVGSVSDCRSRSRKFHFHLAHTTFMEIDHEINSKVILPLLLIQDGQLSATGKSMFTSTAYPPRGLSLCRIKNEDMYFN